MRIDERSGLNCWEKWTPESEARSIKELIAESGELTAIFAPHTEPRSGLCEEGRRKKRNGAQAILRATRLPNYQISKCPNCGSGRNLRDHFPVDVDLHPLARLGHVRSEELLLPLVQQFVARALLLLGELRRIDVFPL